MRTTSSGLSDLPPRPSRRAVHVRAIATHQHQRRGQRRRTAPSPRGPGVRRRAGPTPCANCREETGRGSGNPPGSISRTDGGGDDGGTGEERSSSRRRRSPVLFCGEIHEEWCSRGRSPTRPSRARARPEQHARDQRAHRPAREGRSAGSATAWCASSATRPVRVAVPEQYGGASPRRLCAGVRTFAQIDATLSVVMGVHQSIGFRASCSAPRSEGGSSPTSRGRKLAGFALLQRVDAYNIESRAVSSRTAPGY
jgi:hypothetical protein